MNRNMKLALALVALLQPPLASSGIAADWQVVQTGENFDVVWSGGPRDNLVGGGNARMTGGGDNTEVLYAGPLPSEAPVIASLSGGGEDLSIVYSPVPATSPTLAAPSGVRPTEMAAAGRANRAR